MHHHRSRPILLPMRIPLVLLLWIAVGCGRASKSANVAPEAQPETGRVTFVQWSDPHVFDAGAAREREGIEEEQLDNWSALHWAVMQTNRLVLEDHRKIDFVVISGDFGLYNVKIEDLPDFKYEKGTSTVESNCRHDAKEGPGTPISMAEATELVARELRALVVKKVYIVPGNNDLCDEDPRNRYRYAAFILLLKKAIDDQQLARKKNLADAAASVGKLGKPLPVEPPPAQEIVDLTFTLEKLYKAQDPHVLDLVSKLEPKEKERYLRASGGASGSCSDNRMALPFENGFCLLGLDSSYFKPHNDDTSVKKKIPAAADTASTEAMATLNDQIQTGGTYLLFTHTPDIEDPFRGSTADPGSSWKLPAAAREKWNGALKRDELIAVFAGHFHSTNRQIYPHNFSYVKQLDAAVAKKFWLAPSLAAKYQAGLPAPKTARGIFLFSVTKKGIGGTAPTGDTEVEATPIWFSPLNQKPPLPAEDKLAAARALEEDGEWDQAAQKYLALTADPALDSTTREIALAGYERAHGKTERWWWKSPPLRWLYLHRWGVGSTGVILAALLLLYFLIYWFLRINISSRQPITRLTVRLFPHPWFTGKAKLNATSQITEKAPADVFGAHMLVAAEDIHKRLVDEQEPFMAKHITLLTPSSSAFDTLISSVPNVKGADKVGAVLKFLSILMKTFQWNIDSGIAVFPPDKTTPAAAGTTPLVLAPGGKLSGYAVLQWGWFIRKRFVREENIQDNSAMRNLAQHLTDLVIGEAFSEE